MKYEKLMTIRDIAEGYAFESGQREDISPKSTYNRILYYLRKCMPDRPEMGGTIVVSVEEVNIILKKNKKPLLVKR